MCDKTPDYHKFESSLYRGPRQFAPPSYDFAQRILLRLPDEFPDLEQVAVDVNLNAELEAEEQLDALLDRYDEFLTPPPSRLDLRIYFACKKICVRVVELQDLFARCHYSETWRFDEREYFNLSKELYEALEVHGSIGFNYLNNHNYKLIKETLPRQALFRMKRACLVEQGDVARLFLENLVAERLAYPYEERTGRLASLFDQIKRNVASTERPKRRFFAVWVSAVKTKIFAQCTHDASHVLDLVKWIRLYDGLIGVSEDPRSVRNHLRGAEPWGLPHRSDIEAFVENLMAPPPPFTEHSLGRNHRIGLRQFELRPDLAMRGLARDGGYLM